MALLVYSKLSTGSDVGRGADVIRTLTAILAVALTVQAADVRAQDINERGNARMVQLQERVDELYERGKYERAYVIYRDELAAVGDKYAQYMVGYMTLQGKGVAPDPAVAPTAPSAPAPWSFAWRPIAARRNSFTYATRCSQTWILPRWNGRIAPITSSGDATATSPYSSGWWNATTPDCRR